MHTLRKGPAVSKMDMALVVRNCGQVEDMAVLFVIPQISGKLQ